MAELAEPLYFNSLHYVYLAVEFIQLFVPSYAVFVVYLPQNLSLEHSKDRPIGCYHGHYRVRFLYFGRGLYNTLKLALLGKSASPLEVKAATINGVNADS